MCYPVVMDFARPIADLMNQLRSCSTELAAKRLPAYPLLIVSVSPQVPIKT